ncbi:MAG: chemotaxis response regulator protein-glutamate methylesterase [Verrucomicrobiota bacterium]
MPKIRVLIVDDSVVIRKLLTDCLQADPDIEVAGTAANGQIALSKITQINPDLVTLDVEMPFMDGHQTVAAIRKTHPRLPIIMFSTLTEHGADATFRALSLGANDFVTKPSNVGSVGAAMEQIRLELLPRIKNLCRREPIAKPATTGGASACAAPVDRPRGVDVLAIGVSTGGPNALAALLPELAVNFPVPIVIVQHMPPLFTRLLADRLGAACKCPAHEGRAGALLKAGEIWVAPGGLHMEVEKSPEGVRLRIHEGPPENSCRPAVDVLFRSVASVYGGRVLAVVLTGMGQDGLRGCEFIREAGGMILAQDEASSVVWGMPGAVSNAGLAEKILPLSELAAEINTRVFGAAAASSFATKNRPAQHALAKAL